MKAPGDEVGGYAVADSGEGPGVPLIYRPNWETKGRKKFLCTPTHLLSQGLDPPLQYGPVGQFLYISLRRESLHDYDEVNLRRVHLYLTKLVTWSNRDEDWKNANSLFQRRFLCRRRPRILRSLLTPGGGGASFETNTFSRQGRVIKITLGEEWASPPPSVKSQCYAQCKKGITYPIASTL